MTAVQGATPPHTPDASDVVEGPVGSAALKDPATSGPMGADLDALPPIDADGDAAIEDGSTVGPAPDPR
ncbi:MAG TPA: hypothetical protein VF323_06090 [Candidatus Limnocylindrales bacterium]